MIIMFDLNSVMYNQIIELINQGKYPSIESFIDIATKNQITLEKQRNNKNNEMITIQDNTSNALILNGKEQSTVEPILIDDKVNYNPSNVLMMNGKEPSTVEPILIDDKSRYLPIWGMINRFTPSKFVLRMLVHSLINSNSLFIDFKQFANMCVLKAVEIRNKIEKKENNSLVIRGESFKIGFPKKDLKSQQRFIHFYIGNLNSNNAMSGILGDLEFVVIKKILNNNIPSLVIGITEYGFQFSKMYSPLLDDMILNQKVISSSLSKEEISFLISHLKKVKPGDYKFLHYIYTAIKNGYNKPSALRNFISNYFEKFNISSPMMNSFQVGAISRLNEMKFIRIKKNGIYTEYIINKDVPSPEEI